MKKRGILAVVALAGVSVFALASCGQNFLYSGDMKGSTKPGLYEGLESKEGIYGLGAITTSALLETATGTTGGETTGGETTGGETTGGETTGGETTGGETTQLPEQPSSEKEEADDFQKYLSMIEELFRGDLLTTKVTDNTSTDAAYSNYTYCMTVNGKDFGGENVQHVFFYNETLVVSETERDYDRDDAETEVKTYEHYMISGIMISGGTQYLMEGVRTAETEQEGKEFETKNEFTVRAYQNEDKTGYSVSMTYEEELSSERNESETERSYTYCTYLGRELIEKTKVEFSDETEGGKQETEYEVMFLSGASRGSYEIEREIVNGRERLKVSYNIDGARGEYYVTEKNGEYFYTFSDNTHKSYSWGKR